LNSAEPPAYDSAGDKRAETEKRWLFRRATLAYEKELTRNDAFPRSRLNRNSVATTTTRASALAAKAGRF
jgi:hypothetical protein